MINGKTREIIVESIIRSEDCWFTIDDLYLYLDNLRINRKLGCKVLKRMIQNKLVKIDINNDCRFYKYIGEK